MIDNCTEEQEKEITARIVENINRISDLLKFSEAKCLSVMAINTALCVFYFNIKNIIQPSALSGRIFYVYYTLFLLAIGLAFISSLISLFAVKPKFVDDAESKNNFLFYKNIKERTYLEIKNHFIDYSCGEKDKYADDLCKIMVAYSKITFRKNVLFSNSVLCACASVLFFAVFSLYCFFIH